MTNRTALITGAAGFLGSFLTAALLNRGWQIYALVRSKPDQLPQALLAHELRGNPAALERLTVLEGDVTRPLLGLTSSMVSRLQNVTDVWHCAANFEIGSSHRKAIVDTNVVGTKHALDLAHTLTGQSIRFHFLSTAYAGLQINDTCFERLSDRRDGTFRTSYEWTKSRAEHLVMAAREERHLDVRIYRPSVVSGHFTNGQCLSYNGYQGVFRALYILRRMLQNAFGPDFDRNLRLRVAADPDLRLNLVPVDYVIDAMICIADQEISGTPIFNITHSTGNQLSMLFERGTKALALEGIQLSDKHDFRRRPKSSFERLFDRLILFQAPYLLESLSFDTTNYAQVVPGRLLHAPILSSEYFDRMNHVLLHRLQEEFEVVATPTVDAVS
jgi:thioester reductase-like protein